MRTAYRPYASRMGVELRQLRALVAVVEEGTFTDAAIALGTTQASVSRAVAALEGELGTRVVRRSSPRATPTAAGARVLEHARRVLHEVAVIDRVRADSPEEVRLGYAWSALGRHTVEVQRRWTAARAGRSLSLVASNTPTAGLAEGACDVAVLRRPLEDRRFVVEPVGLENRYAVLARTDPLARRSSVRLADFAGRTVARSRRTGTTGDHLWADGPSPAGYVETHEIEEFLVVVATGRAVGITPEATTRQHRRDEIAYRRVRDAPPVEVALGWWRDAPPDGVAGLVDVVRQAYAGG